MVFLATVLLPLFVSADSTIVTHCTYKGVDGFFWGDNVTIIAKETDYGDESEYTTIIKNEDGKVIERCNESFNPFPLSGTGVACDQTIYDVEEVECTQN